MASSSVAPLTTRSGRVREARRLTRRRVRGERGLFLAEGAKALAEALTVEHCVVEVFATGEATRTHAALRGATDRAGIPWAECEPDAVTSLSGTVTPQGLVAVCRVLDVEGGELLDAFAHERRAATQLVVCADVRDPGNAGTIIRTADAAGAAGLVLAGTSVDPYNAKSVRATVGSLFHLPVACVDDCADFLDRAHERGLLVLAAVAGGELDLFDASVPSLLCQPVVWVFGNEAHGLPGDLAERADHRVSIPIHGRAESLNLATAAAVCLYETVRAGLRS